MGSKHYHKAVDCWAVGCVMAELASLRPIFKGEEAKLDSKKNVPFQKDQLLKVIEVLGKPDGERQFFHRPSYVSTFTECRRTGMAGDEAYPRVP
jgi:serine/threonine protein kinase